MNVFGKERALTSGRLEQLNWSRRETGRQSPAAVLQRWVIVAEIKRQPQGKGLARHLGPSVSTRMLVPSVAFI